ncbi:MAG: glycoside hydrolase family 127 protein, partial [Candidatus Hodarchaeota archaeon]
MNKFNYPIIPLPLDKVQITDDFWAPRIETSLRVTIPHVFKKCEKTNRFGNFSKAAGLIESDVISKYPYDDSDVFKIIEGAAYSLYIKRDPQLEEYIDELIEKIAGAQEDDGYLFTHRTINPERLQEWIGKNRWELVTVLSHELYNVGHLYEAAVAYYEITGKRKLLDVALKNAELIDNVFGPGKNESPPGHQEIEIGLVKLYRITGDENYLKLTKFFLDIRGSKDRIGYEEYKRQFESFPWTRSMSFEYNQTHKKVIEQNEAVGHAVRAVYMYSAMVDVGVYSNNRDYIDAVARIWNNVVSKKLYITGGIGARSYGEAFGDAYELPNYYLPMEDLGGYGETCAAIGNVLWNHRLFLLYGDAKYLDVLERTLYNGLIVGVSMDGKKFFYPNPLASDGNYRRRLWYACACCPSNIARFIPSIPRYIYAQKDDTIFINLFIGSNGKFIVEGQEVSFSQETDYPWNGSVKIVVNSKKKVKFTLKIRVPGWSLNLPLPSDLYRYLSKKEEAFNLKINGELIKLNVQMGYISIERLWEEGDVIKYDIPMPIRRVLAHEKVEEDRDKIALERGPIVYCVERPNKDEEKLQNFSINDDIVLKAEYRRDILNGIVVIKGKMDSPKKTEEFEAIPYYSWAHRGRYEMS